MVASMSSIASAYLTPGNGGGVGQQPNPPHYCENPYGPCDQHGNPLPGNGGPGGGSHQGNGHGPRPPQHPPYDPSYPTDPTYPTYPSEPSYGYREVKQIYVGRTVRNERLPLRQLAGLDSRYNGWEVVSVRAQTRPNSPSTTIAQLVSGGRIVAEQRNPGYQLFLAPQSRLILGVTANDLQLTISGSTIIDVLEIEVINTQGGGNGGYEPNPYPQSDRIDINIYRSTIGNDRVDLTSYIDMYQYRGMRIESVEIRARADYNVAIAELMINSFRLGTVQFSGGYTQPQTIFLNQRPVLGQGADSIILNTRGNMTIESVVLHLSRY